VGGCRSNPFTLDAGAAVAGSGGGSAVATVLAVARDGEGWVGATATAGLA